MKKGEQCSLQYHEFKHETIYVISGELKLIIGDSEESLDEINLNPTILSYCRQIKYIECME